MTNGHRLWGLAASLLMLSFIGMLGNARGQQAAGPAAKGVTMVPMAVADLGPRSKAWPAASRSVSSSRSGAARAGAGSGEAQTQSVQAGDAEPGQ
jgi:hypothetical protein